MKILVAVATSHQATFRLRSAAQRATWGAAKVDGVDVRFFVGRGGLGSVPDEIALDVGDSYDDLPAKTKAICAYALEHGYDYVVKIDDDVYLSLERLAAAVPIGADYCGRVRLPSSGLPAPYCSGFCYWLSRRAMKVLVDSKLFFQTRAEDVITGNTLLQAGIHPKDDPRYNIVMSKRSARTGTEGPRRGNEIIAACEFDPIAMQVIDLEFQTLPSKQGFMMLPKGTPFDSIDVVLKTFLRDGLMTKCVQGIEKNMPGARIILLDDGRHTREKRTFYAEMQMRGHVVRQLPFDTGYGAKNNIGASLVNRQYVLRIADDFDMNAEAADGVLKLLNVLKADSNIGIASGRVNNSPYECNLRFEGEPGAVDVYADAVEPSHGAYTICDMTVNYSLIRSELFCGFKWDERYKIGGDHYDLYGYATTQGFLTAYVHGVNVNTFEASHADVDRDYAYYRGRARLALPWAFERHGWRSFTSIDGRVDTLESINAWVQAYDIPAPSKDPTARSASQEGIKARRAYQKHLLQTADARRNAHFGNHSPQAPVDAFQPTYGPYFLPANYQHRDTVPHFDDTTTEGMWQLEVYLAAQEWFYSKDCSSIIDIGCGSGTKLLRFFSDTSCTGVEVEPTLSWLKKTYPENHWLLPEEASGQYDMVICSDVIEHVTDPEALLLSMMKHDPKVIVLSTPARELIPGAGFGPPRNKHHVREWASPEFSLFVESVLGDKMSIAQHFISNAEQFTMCTILVRK